ncbi:hypothetical protein WKH57_01080 [Niallia taxi]|uniref:hypothetical protein n=1 Tax=Niallia taxi TaxID=2499688 RepID=UPI0031822804
MLKRLLEYIWYSITVNILFGVIYGFNLSAMLITIPLFTVGIYMAAKCFKRGIKQIKEGINQLKGN